MIDDNLSLSADDNATPDQQSLPDNSNQQIPVPQDQTNAGTNGTGPAIESPESLDAAINQDDRDQTIDPYPSYPASGDTDRRGEQIVQPLPEDNDRPFSPPTDPIEDANEDIDLREQGNDLGQTHPATDTNIEVEEAYDEGLSGAAEAREPNTGNAVLDYDAEADSRSKSDDKATS